MFHWEWTVFGYLFYNFPFFGFHSAISYLLFDLQNQSLIDDVIALNFGKLLMLVFVCFCWIFNELSGKYLKKMYAYRLYANITYTHIHTHDRTHTYTCLFLIQAFIFVFSPQIRQQNRLKSLIPFCYLLSCFVHLPGAHSIYSVILIHFNFFSRQMWWIHISKNPVKCIKFVDKHETSETHSLKMMTTIIIWLWLVLVRADYYSKQHSSNL